MGETTCTCEGKISIMKGERRSIEVITLSWGRERGGRRGMMEQVWGESSERKGSSRELVGKLCEG
jgi:hypothetical protein